MLSLLAFSRQAAGVKKKSFLGHLRLMLIVVLSFLDLLLAIASVLIPRMMLDLTWINCFEDGSFNNELVCISLVLLQTWYHHVNLLV